MDLKRRAAAAAIELIDGATVVGLGTGSTASAFVRLLAEERAAGRLAGVVGIPTSRATARLAEELEIPLSDLDERPEVDVTVDGADEVDPRLDLIKGLGGALTREKIVASASRRLVIIVDDSKVVERLGSTAPVPVEVLPFGVRVVERKLGLLGGRVEVRERGGQVFRTDQENVVLDWYLPEDAAPSERIARALDAIPGVVAHGLFLGMADTVVVAGAEGTTLLERD